MHGFKALVKSQTYTKGDCEKTTKAFTTSRRGTTTTKVNKHLMLAINLQFTFATGIAGFTSRSSYILTKKVRYSEENMFQGT